MTSPVTTNELIIKVNAVDSDALKNLATGSHALSVGSTIVTNNGWGNTSFGDSCRPSGSLLTLIGCQAESHNGPKGSTLVGCDSNVDASGCIHLGASGTNSTAGSFTVSLSPDGEWQHTNTYMMCDVNGYIPGARMSIQAAGAPSTSTAGTVGQFYVDTTNQDAYICVGVSPYTWRKISQTPEAVALFTTVGTPTITNKVASGFSLNDYITFTNQNASYDNHGYAYFKFTTPTTPSGHVISLPFYSEASSGYVNLFLGVNASQKFIADGDGTNGIFTNSNVTAAANTTYWCKVTFDCESDPEMTTTVGFDVVVDNGYTKDTIQNVNSWTRVSFYEDTDYAYMLYAMGITTVGVVYDALNETIDSNKAAFNGSVDLDSIFAVSSYSDDLGLNFYE